MKRAIYKPNGALAVASQSWGGEFETLEGGEVKAGVALHGPNADTAVVDICGPLTQHECFLWENYDAIRVRVAAALACPQAARLVLKIDSPGGDVAGCFELAREIRAMATQAGKSLVAYADGMAASAAYALASAADEIVVSSTSFVGSIGVIEAMCDQTAADQAQGLKYVLVASGARKADGNPHVAMSKEAVASMQTQVDGLAEIFFELVGDMRGAKGLTADKAKSLQAGMFFGAGAVSAGLADRVMSFTELLAAPVAAQGEGTMPKATYMDEARGALKKAADEGNEMAKKMLALEEEPKDGDEKKDAKKAEGEDEKKAKAEADEKKAKAEADDADKKAKAEADDADKKAQASAAFDLAREVHALKARIESDDRAKAVADLFATRPDFDDKIKATLSALSLEKIKEACETFPKIAAASNPRAAAAQVQGTRGAHQAAPAPADDSDGAFIDRAMGLRAQAGVIKHERNTLELGVMTREQARAKVKELEAAISGSGAAK